MARAERAPARLSFNFALRGPSLTAGAPVTGRGGNAASPVPGKNRPLVNGGEGPPPEASFQAHPGPPKQTPLGKAEMGTGQNSTTRGPLIVVYVSSYQGSILGTYF